MRDYAHGHFTSVLKMDSNGGLRIVEEWTNRGRDIEGGVKPRLETVHTEV